MRELAALLAHRSSTLPAFVRPAVIGFRAQLAHLQEAAGGDDVAQADLRKAIAALDEVLGGGPPGLGEAVGTLPEGPAAGSVPGGDLVARWMATGEGKALLPDGWKDLSAGALYLLTWRLPPRAAQGWRADWHRAHPTAKAGGDVPGPCDEPLIPGIATLSTTAPLPPDYPAGGPLTERLARIVSAAIWFAENDASLRFCLQSVYRFGFAPMQALQRQRFVAATRDRLERFAAAEQAGSVEDILRGYVAVDEAANSLVHQPLAHSQSAYAMIGLACRGLLSEVQALAERAGIKAHLQVIAGNFADALRLTDNADIEGQGGGVPGDVIHCCRVYLSVNGDVSPGRVIYKPRKDPGRS